MEGYIQYFVLHTLDSRETKRRDLMDICDSLDQTQSYIHQFWDDGVRHVGSTLLESTPGIPRLLPGRARVHENTRDGW